MRIKALLAVLLISLFLTGCSSPDIHGTEGIDYDLSLANARGAINEVQNIMSDPGAYAGITIRLRGSYVTRVDNSSNQQRHYVYITDRCCEEYIELAWGDEEPFVNLPPENTAIEVTGVLTGDFIAVTEITVR